MKRMIPLFLCSFLLLTGCSALLEREYSTVEPHSSKFWESESSGTLRAENYQDIVNDLLILIGQHAESATVRLYDYDGDMSVTEILEQATSEVRQETPLGAYAVEYITSTNYAEKDYYEIFLQISYRRTAEQVNAVVNATGVDALRPLLYNALDAAQPELAVRIGYWDDSSPEQIQDLVEQVRAYRKVPEETPWLLFFYPEATSAGLIEIILDVPEELYEQYAPAPPTTPEEEPDAESGEEEPSSPESVVASKPQRSLLFGGISEIPAEKIESET